jgi:predicted TIM-barrel fold metal-dependent hydrolase
VISFIAEGVFVRFPKLKVVLQESGFAWMFPLMCRLDASYGMLKDNIPRLDRLPSEYCREHFYFTTQPIEEPPKPRYLKRAMEHLDMDDRYLFATDYPHWDFDAPDRSIPDWVSAELKRKILFKNALSLYKKLPPLDDGVAANGQA